MRYQEQGESVIPVSKTIARKIVVKFSERRSKLCFCQGLGSEKNKYESSSRAYDSTPIESVISCFIS